MFCTKCGNQLKENARFCTKCGAPVRSKAAEPAPATVTPTEPAVVQSVQPAQTIPEPAPATVVTTKPAVVQSVQPAQTIPEPAPATLAPTEPAVVQNVQPAQTTPKPAPATGTPENQSAAEKTIAPEIFKFRAPSFKGEAVLGTMGRNASSAASNIIPGPGKEIASSLKNYFVSLGAFFKNPLLMIPTLLFTLIIPGFWMLLNILQANGINPWPLKILSFLSCANGGMSGGIFGGFGGIIGKGVFVAGVVTLFSLIFRKKGGSKRSFGEILKGSFGVNRETLGVYFTGIGIAFLLYLFLTGGATRISALCGFAAMIITATSALNNGFVARLVNSVTAKGKHATGQAGAGLMRGFTVGYAASAILGFITGTRIIPVILAIHFLIAGAVFIILQLTGVIKPKKGAAV